MYTIIKIEDIYEEWIYLCFSIRGSMGECSKRFKKVLKEDEELPKNGRFNAHYKVRIQSNKVYERNEYWINDKWEILNK